MEHRLVRGETPLEFFRDQLERAMEHQRVSTSAFTEFYLVNLLAGAVRGVPLPPAEEPFDETPLALLWIRALEASRAERLRLLRALGDTALFMSGFFAESLARGLNDLGYYHGLGGRAYRALSREAGTGAAGVEVFDELGSRFGQFSDLLQEVSETTRLSNQQSLVRLYERWLQTGSARAASLLQARGITPVAPAETPLQ